MDTQQLSHYVAEMDSTKSVNQLFWEWLAAHGLPRAYYPESIGWALDRRLFSTPQAFRMVKREMVGGGMVGIYPFGAAMIPRDEFVARLATLKPPSTENYN